MDHGRVRREHGALRHGTERVGIGTFSCRASCGRRGVALCSESRPRARAISPLPPWTPQDPLPRRSSMTGAIPAQRLPRGSRRTRWPVRTSPTTGQRGAPSTPRPSLDSCRPSRGPWTSRWPSAAACNTECSRGQAGGCCGTSRRADRGSPRRAGIQGGDERAIDTRRPRPHVSCARVRGRPAGRGCEADPRKEPPSWISRSRRCPTPRMPSSLS